jgi:hypothetical protein
METQRAVMQNLPELTHPGDLVFNAPLSHQLVECYVEDAAATLFPNFPSSLCRLLRDLIMLKLDSVACPTITSVHRVIWELDCVFPLLRVCKGVERFSAQFLQRVKSEGATGPVLAAFLFLCAAPLTDCDRLAEWIDDNHEFLLALEHVNWTGHATSKLEAAAEEVSLCRVTKILVSTLIVIHDAHRMVANLPCRVSMLLHVAFGSLLCDSCFSKDTLENTFSAVGGLSGTTRQWLCRFLLDCAIPFNLEEAHRPNARNGLVFLTSWCLLNSEARLMFAPVVFARIARVVEMIPVPLSLPSDPNAFDGFGELEKILVSSKEFAAFDRYCDALRFSSRQEGAKKMQPSDVKLQSFPSAERYPTVPMKKWFLAKLQVQGSFGANFGAESFG